MKKSGIFLLSAAAIALMGGGIVYYPELENALSKILQQQKHHKEREEGDPEHKPTIDSLDLAEEAIVKLSDDQSKKIGLEIETAAPGTMTLTLSSRGKIILDPNRLAHVIPKVPGIVKEARKSVGNQVKAGEVIAVLESQEMADLKADYLSAASKEKLAASLFERETSLYQKGISSGQDYLNAQNSWEEAQINLQLTSQKLRAFGLSDEAIALLSVQKEDNLRDYEIYAPIDGTVLKRHLTMGEFIDHQATIYEIADLSAVLAETAIYPKDIHRVREGQQVEVTNLENHSTATGTLIYLSPMIDGDAIAVKAIAFIDNPKGDWRPGLFVNLNIATDQISSPLVISKEALQKMDGKDCAFVKTERGFEKRELKVGQCDHQNIEVLSGLLPGEKYVSKNPFLLKAEMNKDSAKDED